MIIIFYLLGVFINYWFIQVHINAPIVLGMHNNYASTLNILSHLYT